MQVPFVIPSTDGLYAVWRDGRVTSRLGIRGKVLSEPHELTPSVRKDGYRCVNIKIDGRFRTYLVHRLVAEAYLPSPPPGVTDVRHLDGNKANNDVSNLAWGTRAENEADKVIHGRSNRGERQGQSKLKEADVVYIRCHVKTRADALTAAKIRGCSVAAIYDVLNRRTWKWLA